jgi:hypothetical protein
MYYVIITLLRFHGYVLDRAETHDEIETITETRMVY